MAKTKDIYVLGQSPTGSIVELGEEIRLDLDLEPSIRKDVGTLYGTITDGTDPIPGVTVKVTDNLFNPLYHSITNEFGEYTINNIPADAQYNSVAQIDGYDLGVGSAFVMQAEQQIEQNFTLNESPDNGTAIIAGEAVGTDGSKIEGVTVELYDNSDPDAPIKLKTTHSNEYGQWAFFFVPTGFYKVTLSKPGYKSTSSTMLIDTTTEVTNVEIPMEIDPITKKGTVNGVIRDEEGNGVPDAFVVLYEVGEDESLTPIRKTVTNADGKYLFEQVDQGNYKIKANKTEDMA